MAPEPARERRAMPPWVRPRDLQVVRLALQHADSTGRADASSRRSRLDHDLARLERSHGLKRVHGPVRFAVFLGEADARESSFLLIPELNRVPFDRMKAFLRGLVPEPDAPPKRKASEESGARWRACRMTQPAPETFHPEKVPDVEVRRENGSALPENVLLLVPAPAIVLDEARIRAGNEPRKTGDAGMRASGTRPGDPSVRADERTRSAQRSLLPGKSARFCDWPRSERKSGGGEPALRHRLAAPTRK